MRPFTSRDNFAAIAHARSELVWEVGTASDQSRATVAIPTFKRFDTLIEAIASATAQTGVAPPDIIIVDNEGHGTKAEKVRSAIGNLRAGRIRYYVNPANLGMFGNWNRCIELGEREWLTILNDDDVLRPDFLRRCLRILDHRPNADGIVCRKTERDRRTDRSSISRRSDRSRSLLRKVVRGALDTIAFRGGAMRVTPQRLFFGNQLGNGAGFLFRRDTALRLGGYDPEEWPSADFLLYIRMALDGELLWLNEKLAEVGIGDNESMAPDVLLAFVSQLHAVRVSMANGIVPESWLAMAPQIAADHVQATEHVWGVRLDPELVERDLQIKLPRPDPRRTRWMQLCRGIL